MTPVEFPEQNKTWAKDQPEYRPLPSFCNDRETISCWQLDWRERVSVLLRGRIWLRQSNFGRALQPQLLQIESPFVAE
jgi:hypothetical protein